MNAPGLRAGGYALEINNGTEEITDMNEHVSTVKLDLLAFAAHPDDAELNSGGLIAKMARLGRKVGIVDITAGQMATRGSVELRRQEAANAAEILGLVVRENLGFTDGALFADDPEARKKFSHSSVGVIISSNTFFLISGSFSRWTHLS